MQRSHRQPTTNSDRNPPNLEMVTKMHHRRSEARRRVESSGRSATMNTPVLFFVHTR
jgi:hypothetical protein